MKIQSSLKRTLAGRLLLLAGFLCWVGCGQQQDTNQSSDGKWAEPEAVELLPSGPLSQESGLHDWPCFLGMGQDGYSDERGIRTDWSEGKLPVLWTGKVGEGYAPGVVSGERYFHFDRTPQGARLRCLNANTGQPSWEFVYPSDYVDIYGYDGGPRSSPTIDGDTVFIYGVEGMLHALDASNGDVKWKLNVNKKYGVHQNFFGTSSPPVVFKDKLLIMVGGSPADNKIRLGQLDKALPDGTAVVALDKESGEVIYELGDDLASYTAIKLISHQGRDWAFAWARKSLIAFDPNSGEIDFEFPWRSSKFESVNASTPVVFDGHVFLSECYSIGSVLLKFGDDIEGKFQVVWKDEGRDMSMMTHWNTSVFYDGYLYGSSGRNANDATLRCIDAMTGEVKWSQPGFRRCNMSFVDGHLVVVGEQGVIMLVKANPEKFDPVSLYEAGPEDNVRFVAPCWAAPVIANGKMYVRGKGTVVCFELVK